VIIDEIRLQNFGVYREEQVFNLTPLSPEKPVILIGALNGSGKTTLLDALQLALYGKFAKTSNRGSMAYENYLLKCINRYVAPKEGSELSVSFHFFSVGKRQDIRVVRRWAAASQGVKEALEVSRCDDSNGKFEFDAALTESWQEQVDYFVPASVSPLFFFDGEKIEQFADMDNSKEILRTAVQSLLGLDLVDRLESDLVILERQKRTEAAPTTQSKELGQLEEELALQETLLKKNDDERARWNTEKDGRHKTEEQIRREFEALGGLQYQQKAGIENDQLELDTKIVEAKEKAFELASGVLPLVLVGDLLDSLSKQDRIEDDMQQGKALLKMLEERDGRLLKVLSKAGDTKKLLPSVKAWLSDDRISRAEPSKVEHNVMLSRQAKEQLRYLVHEGLEQAAKAGKESSDEIDEIQNKIVAAKRRMQSVPEEDSIARLFERHQKSKMAVIEAETRLKALDEQAKSTKFKILDLTRKTERLREEDVRERFDKEEDTRIIRHSLKTRETLQHFKRSVVARHVETIQKLITESYKTLLRKQTLLDKVIIDPTTFELRLLTHEGDVLSPERLSAGERQLLGVSMLWGLARTSGRALPAIIDTPLGRLDSTHRMHLVERYIPRASHQVVVLSTDEEIDMPFFEKLRPFTSRSYCLEYDDRSKGTSVREGYFWEKA
jgi:DNA sulfur modification protein DndD